MSAIAAAAAAVAAVSASPTPPHRSPQTTKSGRKTTHSTSSPRARTSSPPPPESDRPHRKRTITKRYGMVDYEKDVIIPGARAGRAVFTAPGLDRPLRAGDWICSYTGEEFDSPAGRELTKDSSCLAAYTQSKTVDTAQTNTGPGRFLAPAGAQREPSGGEGRSDRMTDAPGAWPSPVQHMRGASDAGEEKEESHEGQMKLAAARATSAAAGAEPEPAAAAAAAAGPFGHTPGAGATAAASSSNSSLPVLVLQASTRGFRSRSGGAMDVDATAAVSSDSLAAKRPRHFHEGPDQTRSMAATSSAASTPLSQGNGPPPLRLYQYALESIFAFLSLGGLHSVLSVSRSWSAAVGTMPSIGAALSRFGCPKVSRSQVFSAVCGSRLGLHIGELEWSHEIFTSHHLQRLGAGTPNLSALRCEFAHDQKGSVAFPPKLTSLRLSLSKLSRLEVSVVLEGIRQLPLLRELQLWTGSCDLRLVSLAPLKSISLLKTLDIQILQPSDAQIDELRALTDLTELSVEPITPDLMRRLLRQPHSLQLQSFGSTDLPLTEDECVLLPSLLPSATRLYCRLGDIPADLSFLGRNLRELELWCELCVEVLSATNLLQALKSCTRLTKLEFMYSAFSSAQMSELLPCLSELQELTLSHLDHIDSLRFLSSGSITRTLTHLQLVYLQNPNLHTRELQHVHALLELRSLDIRGCFVEPLDPLVIFFDSHPTSTLLPKLTHFNFNFEEE